MGNLKASIGRKVAMALSALFLVFFLLIHVSVNLVSVFSENAFNAASHFMGNNPLVQFIMQPILVFGVDNFCIGIYFRIKKQKSCWYFLCKE